MFSPRPPLFHQFPTRCWRWTKLNTSGNEARKIFLILSLIMTLRLPMRRRLLVTWAEGAIYFLVRGNILYQKGISLTLHWAVHLLSRSALFFSTSSSEKSRAAPSHFTPMNVVLAGSRRVDRREGECEFRVMRLRGNDNGRSLTRPSCSCFSLGGIGLAALCLNFSCSLAPGET